MTNFLRTCSFLVLCVTLPSLLVQPASADEERHSASRKPFSVLTGIDVLERDGFTPLKGKRIGLITNHTGVNRDGKSTIEILKAAPDVKLVALFSPEHGIAGKLDVEKIGDARDPTTGLQVYSLYGETRKPKKEHLADLDALVFDIQDIGARFYTYISTLGGAMEVAAEHGVEIIVLDRPNPIGGVAVQGPLLDAGRESFVGYHTLPVRHGMTVGELAMLFNTERKIGAKLHVVKVEGWQRGDLFDATGLYWINPSPNMRCLTQALLYPGVGLLEMTNLSVGRGTDTPFEVIGAPWLNARSLLQELNGYALTGVTFVPIRFTPEDSKFKGEACEGLNIIVTDRNTFDPLRTGLALAVALRNTHVDTWKQEAYMRLLGNEQVFKAVLAAVPVAEIEAGYQNGLADFNKIRQAYLLYE